MWDKPSADAGKIAGSLNFYADLSLAVVEIGIGFILDYFGRKALSIVGFFVYGLIMMAGPHIPKIYPGLGGLMIV